MCRDPLLRKCCQDHQCHLSLPDGYSLPYSKQISDRINMSLNTKFVATVQRRGAAMIKATRQSSALSAASATCDYIRDWVLRTPKLDLILTDHHHHHQKHLNNDLSFSYPLHHYHPMIFPDPFSTPCTFPHHNPSALYLQPPIETLSGYPEDLNLVGLNLGGQTYHFCGVYDPVTRSRVVGAPKCQVDGCNADLSLVKNYHRRHKVCEFHSKAAAVFAAGLTQRFCQQCSRFHVLSEFDKSKRSCRKRLADHNRRRRRLQQSPHSDRHPSSHASEDARNSPSQKFPCN